MNIFYEIKSMISVRQVAESYGLKVNRNGMACCPFHNDKHPSMKIDSSHYYCFGCGAHAGIVALMPLYKGVHMLADIGNGTMNTLVITNGRAMSDRMYTDKLGVHQCVKRIYNAVQAECGKLPDESLIEDFLRNGTADTSNRILSVMQTEAEKYTVEIFDKLSEYEYDPEMVKLHIIGGGGCLIRNFGTYDTDSVEIISDIEVEILGVKRDNYTIPEYKAAMRATEELTAELEILNAEKQEAESVIASVGAEIADAREEVEESKKHLDEINEQIADREKRYAVYEKKIDKVLAAGKPVAKELAVIRKNAKQLPSILGSEPSVKISEKDFNRLIDMAQASGTLEKLNEIYDRELEHMQGIIDDLMVQVKTWKDKVLQYDKFFNVKGLVEEFKEFVRPKSIKDRMEAKQKVVEKQKCEQVVNSTARREKDIAI